MSYLLLAAIAAALIYLGMRWFVSADPARIAFVASTAAITIVAVVALLLIFTGRIGSLYMLGMLAAPAAMAWFRRRKAAAGGFGDPGAARSGRKSEAVSAWLHMELDMDSQRIDGKVMMGRFAGRRLGELDPQSLLALYGECRDDADSARLLEAYLDRRLGPDWRSTSDGGGRRQGGGGSMSRDEALEILGLEPGASAEAIKTAHRRLMAQMHPDKGGSTYLAAKINEARDLLLGD